MCHEEYLQHEHDQIDLRRAYAHLFLNVFTQFHEPMKLEQPSKPQYSDGANGFQMLTYPTNQAHQIIKRNGRHQIHPKPEF